jgi:DHA2 family multidrug resistance protein
MGGPDARRWLGAFAVFTGAVMAAIDTFVLYVATPHLRGVFSATTSEISWINTSYAIGSLSLMLMSGWLAGRFGKRRICLAAVFSFAVFSVLCGVSGSLETLVVSRFLQGAAGGVLIPVELMLLRGMFPPSAMGKVMGVYAATTMLGPALGPFIGGYLVENHTWNSIFFVNVPACLLGLVLVWRFVAPDGTADGAQRRPFDWIGLGLLLAGVFCLTWLLERGSAHFWFESELNVWLAWGAVAALLLLVCHELMTHAPLVNLRILRVRAFATVTTMNFFLYMVVTATLFMLPLYMQELLRFAPTTAGATLAPRAVVMMVVFPLVGLMLAKVAPKWLVCAGMALGCASAILMAGFTHETSRGDMFWPLILHGLGVVLVLTPLTTVGLSHVPPQDLGAAASLDTAIKQLGASLGVAVCASLHTHFRLDSWGEFRHAISRFSPLFYERFNNVQLYFRLDGFDGITALGKATRLLNSRVEEQVLAVTYRNLFQIVAESFLVLLIVSVLARLARPKCLTPN